MALWYLEGSLDETKMVRKIPLINFPFVIGRSKSLDMVILSHGISREHAEIFMKSGRLYIRDLGSTNGTFVNNERISADTLLTHNTTIHFCEAEFKLTDLEFKEAPDEQMTVIVNVGDRSARKEPSTKSPAKQSVKASADKLERADNSQNHSEPELNGGDDSASNSDSKNKLPRYFSNENIFIQEGGDHANRRLHPRREARWPAEVSIRGQATLQCVTKDFSEVGISLKSSVKIPEQSLVSIELQTFYKGRNRDYSILGVVRHSLLAANGFVVGIQIKQCSDNCSEFIKKYASYQI